MREKINRYFGSQRQNILVALALFFVCFITYSNGLNNQFLIDDYGLFITNTEVHNIEFLQQNFNIDESTRTTGRYYRPILHLLIMFNYLVFGHNPFGYHLVNFLFFFVCCLSIYWFFTKLLGDREVAFLTSLFFCTHPINGVLVNYITMTAYSVMIFAVFFGLMNFLSAVERNDKSFTMISLCWFLIALLSHEMIIAFPLYLVTVLYFVKKFDARKAVLSCIPYFVLVVVYFLFRMKFVSLKASLFDNIPYFDMTAFNYLASFSKLMFWYLDKLISLKGIVLIWVTPIVRENLLWWAAGLFIFLLACFYLIFFIWKRSVRSLALAWFLIGFIPVTMGCLLNPVFGFAIEPHWLLFSSIGCFLLLASFLVEAKRKSNKNLAMVLIIGLIAVYVLHSRHYNYLWGNEKRYCQYWLKTVPGYKRAMFYLAGAYMRDGENQRAREMYSGSLVGYPDDWGIYNNLGLMDLGEGNISSAIVQFQNAIKAHPVTGVPYTNLGSTLLKINDRKGAREAFQKAIELNSFLFEPKLNLARIYEQEGQLKEAVKLYEANLAIDPNDEPSLYGIVELYFRIGEKKKSFAVGKRMLKVSRDPKLLTNLGSVFAQEKFTDMGFAMYMTALRWDPKYKEAYLEMGKLYGNLNQFNRAISFWQEGLKLDPSDGRFKELIAQAQQLNNESREKSSP